MVGGSETPEGRRGSDLVDAAPGYDDNHTLLVSFAKLHGADLVADGLVAADELASLVEELEAHLADPATMTLYSLLCQAWARRPSPGAAKAQ